MKGLVLTPKTRQVTLRDDLTQPTPAAAELLIHVQAVALNPVDELYVSSPIAKQDQRIIGTDFAGIVVGAGSDLANSPDARVKVGARVSGFLQGASSANDRPGAFAEYITAPYDLVWTVPSHVSFEEAATISMCGLTAAQGLFARIGVPTPFPSPYDLQPIKKIDPNEPINVLVYGSSTSLGLYAAQLVRLAPFSHKLRIIGLASKAKHEFLRQAPYSYDALLDYKSPNWIDEVREITGGKGVDYAVDCISEGQTVPSVHNTLAKNGRLAVFRGPVGGRYDASKLAIKPIYGAVWEGLGEEVGYNANTIPADPVARDFATRFYTFLSSASETGELKLQANPVRKMPGGFARIVPDGFALLSGGGGLLSEKTQVAREEPYMRSISGEKLVYTVRENGDEH